MEKTKIDIKNRILNEARTAFTKNGYSKVNTQYLANKLGISKRTLYEYFSSKEYLLEEIVDRDLKEIKLNVNKIIMELRVPGSDFLLNLSKLWNLMSKTSCTFSKEFFEDIRKFAPDQWSKIEKFRAKQIKSNFTKLHSIGVKKGIIKANINKDIFVLLDNRYCFKNKDIFYLIYYNSLHNILVPEVLSELPLTNQEALNNIIDVLLSGSLTEKGRTDYLKING